MAISVQGVNLLLHIATLFLFLVAAGVGVRELWLNGLTHDAAALWVTMVATLNAAFRGWLVLILIAGTRAPQPFTIQAALILQMTLALALVVALLSRRWVTKALNEP